MNNKPTQAFCQKCYRPVPFKIMDNGDKKYAVCMICGRRVNLPEVAAYNNKKENETK